MKNKYRSSSCCNNRRRQFNKRFCNFCKRFGHSFETCYLRNKSAVSISVANTESGQLMAPVFAQSQSFGFIFTISRDDLINIIANVIRMVGNASYSSSFSALSGMSPTSWLMDSTCCNHMTPHLSLFSELKLAPHPLNIRTINGSTMSGHNIGSVSTSNRFLGSLMFLTFLAIYSLWDNQLSWVIALSLIILGVLCRIQGRDRSFGPVPKLGVCFPWTTFVFHLLLMFLLLQLLQFLLFLPLLFSMLVLVTHLPLGYNNWLLEVCQVQCL